MIIDQQLQTMQIQQPFWDTKCCLVEFYVSFRAELDGMSEVGGGGPSS